jgi:hypothetical protein
MKDSDQAIEKVLAGLRDAEAPGGMERRILETVQNHSSAHSRWSWLTTAPHRVAVKPMAYAATLAGIVALALVVPALRQRRHAPTQAAKIISSEPLASTPSTIVAENSEPQSSATISRPLRRPKPKRLDLVDTQESLAMREMNAPSRPAPPLPLTQQEKLLVRFVRTRTPEQLAANDPAKWAAHDAQEQSEFDKFFGLSTKEQAAKKHPAKEKPVEEAMSKS